jgi:large subunit ribosomal protein L15
LPLIKRLPQKRGFTNIFRTEYSIINLDRLNIFAPESEVTPEKLQAMGLIKSLRNPVKILGRGEINRPLVVKANKFSTEAKAKIEAAGGKAEEVEYATKAK